MSRYADKTEVSSERSRNEIERTLVRYGADGFSYSWAGDRASIAFTADNRKIRFILSMPDPDESRWTPTGLERAEVPARKAHEQACRQRWRALALMVKAKLEAVNAGIVTFEEEFLAHLVLPGGQTVFEEVAPVIEEAYLTGHVLELLPAAPEAAS